MELKGVMNMFNQDKNNDDLQPKKVSFFRRRSFKYGSAATIFTIAFIVVIILVNIGLTWVSNKYPISIDLTTKQTYKISSQTVKFVKGVKPKIEIDVMSTKTSIMGTTLAPVVKILDQYPQYNSNITVNYIDLTQNPSFAANFKESLSDYDVIVRSGSRYKYISVNDLVTTNTDSSTGQTSITGFTAEQQLDTGILYVTTSNLPTVTFTTGHSEADSSAMQSLLESNNYQVETKNISSDGIDNNAKVLAIVYPKTDFTSEEIKKIDDFLNNGGNEGKNLMVFFDPSQTVLPNLEAYLKDWGLGVGSGVVYDTQNSYGTNPFYLVNGATDSTTLANLPSNMTGEIADSRPVNLLFTTKNDCTTSSLVSSMDTAQLWNPPAGVASATFKVSSSDPVSAYTLMARSDKNLVTNNVSVDSNIIVSGSTDAFNTSLLQEPSLNNADIVLDTINKITNFKSPINIEAKTSDSTTLNIPASQQHLIDILFMAIVPLVVLILGLFVWLRRRHL
jgi:ABC-2 type transport system permease protein